MGNKKINCTDVPELYSLEYVESKDKAGFYGADELQQVIDFAKKCADEFHEPYSKLVFYIRTDIGKWEFDFKNMNAAKREFGIVFEKILAIKLFHEKGYEESIRIFPDYKQFILENMDRPIAEVMKELESQLYLPNK